MFKFLSKKDKQFFSIFSLLSSFSYALVCLVNWSMNPGLWSPGARFILAGMLLCSLIVSIIITANN